MNHCPKPFSLAATIVVLSLSGCVTRQPAPDSAARPPPSPAPVVEAVPPAALPAPSTGRLEERRRLRSVSQAMDVWMLDVGQGQCMFIACPDGVSNILVDCGTNSIGATPDAAIVDWINERNEDAATVTVLVTHGHEDHISMLREHEGVNPALVSRLMLGGGLGDYKQSFLKWAAKTKTQHSYFKSREFKADDQRFACGTARIDLLTVNSTEVPNPAPFESKKNADSAMIRLSFEGRSAIIAGDAEGISEEAAMNNAKKHKLDISGTSLLVGSHHGAESKGSNSTAWLTAVGAHAGAFSARVEYRYRHPRCAVVERYKDQVDSIGASFDMACGDGNPSEQMVQAKLFNTHDNGHVRARFTATSVKYFCQFPTPACDGSLPEDELP